MADSKELVAKATGAVVQFKAVADQIEIISGGTVNGQDAMLLSSMFFSGYFKDIDSLSKAVVRVAFGKRIGVDVATAVTSLYIIDGKPGLEAKAMRNTLVMAGYDILNITPEGKENEYCELEWRYKDKVLGKSKFTVEDAVARGYVDPTCVKVEGFPHKHNDREISRYNKWKKPQPGYETKMTCECKDNWRAMLEEMLMARSTSRGNTKHGSRAFKQEVYEVSELIESPFREDTTAVDVARDSVSKAKTIQELQAITKELDNDTLADVLPDISARTQELLKNDAPKTSTDKSRSAAA